MIQVNYLNHEKELYFTFENRLRNNIFHYQIENTPIDAFSDKNRFFEEIAKAGYATDPNYAATLKAVSKTILKHI